MNFISHSHKHADAIIEKHYYNEYSEIIEAIKTISDEEIKQKFIARKQIRPGTKSLSEAINLLLKEKLIAKAWTPEPPIFKGEEYEKKGRWRLDFAKNSISIEVAFNHREATAHNIIKPVLASELNHISKKIQTKVAVIITATDALKGAGGFDNAIGTYELFQSYLKPYNQIVTVPLIVIGLCEPETFHIKNKEVNQGKL